MASRAPVEDEPSDNALMAAIAEGDRRSFRRLAERHARPMLILAQRVTGNVPDADDIVQDALLKLWTNAGKYRPDGTARFSTWLYRVVLNLAIDRRRKMRPSSPLEASDEPADPAPDGWDLTLGDQRQALLAESLAALPARQQSALSLFYFTELTSTEGAEIMGLSIAAFEALLVRGRQGLRDRLKLKGIKTLGDVV